MRISAPGSDVAPTLATACASLPPEGANFSKGGQSKYDPHALPLRGSLPPEGLISLGAACREIAVSLIASSRATVVRGFTLLELLLVAAIIAVASAGVSFAMRDSAQTQLEREAVRLAALLESGRTRSMASGVPVRWRTTATGFTFDGLPTGSLPEAWLSADITAAMPAQIVLGPEPIIARQSVRLVASSQPNRALTVGTDGVRPFSVRTGDSP